MGGKKKSRAAKKYLKDWYVDIAFWHRLSRWIRRHLRENPWGLFKTAFWVLVGLAVFAALLLLVLAWVLGNTWFGSLQIGADLTRYTVLRMVLFIGAGVVGVVGVIVAYRRQQGNEEGQFLEQLAASARQLGDENPTVQAAGIYSLAGLADRSSQERRQQCVDVLCAYIRLPYAPVEQNDEPGVTTSITRKRTVTTETGSEEEERTVTLRPHDREVRQTIIRVITQHLRRDDDVVSWSDLNLDFTGAFFDYGDFSEAVFGGDVSFTGARFIGRIVNFGGAVFSGNTISFLAARFSGGYVTFGAAEFTGDVTFEGAKFSGAEVSFTGAEFTSGDVNFREAEFTSGTVNFEFALFSGSTVEFVSAEFAGGHVSFILPADWSTPPHVLWANGCSTPEGVEPDRWPPLSVREGGFP